MTESSAGSSIDALIRSTLARSVSPAGTAASTGAAGSVATVVGGGAGAGGPASKIAASSRGVSGGGRPSSRGDITAMGIETLSKELSKLSADMERDIGKVYRKYERLERTMNAERDRKMAARDREAAAAAARAAPQQGSAAAAAQPIS